MRAVFVLVKTDPGHVTSVANEIGLIETFSEAYSTSGEYDLLVKLYVNEIDTLGRLIESDLHSIPHVRETFTILTFEAFAPKR
jgi:DNA-binding Lrp family transcriptional regulator